MFLESPAERIEKVYLSESFVKQTPPACKEKLALLQDVCETVTGVIFERMSGTKTPQGILCLLKQYHYDLHALSAVPDPLLILLEDIQDPGNLGTIFRAGEGAGVSGIVMSSGTVDIYNPKVIRSTMGSVYRVPFLYVEDVSSIIKVLLENDVCVYAAHLAGKALYEAGDYRKGTAFLIGNEGNGLREETAACADALIKIPMEGSVESLNAAVASSVLLYEAYRQRRM